MDTKQRVSLAIAEAIGALVYAKASIRVNAYGVTEPEDIENLDDALMTLRSLLFRVKEWDVPRHASHR